VILAASLLRENVGPVRWSAVFAGLSGVALIFGGGLHLNIAGIACAIGGAFTLALTSIQIRDLGRTEEPLVIVFWFFLLCSAAQLISVLATLPDITLSQWGLLIGAGVGAMFGQLCLTASLRFGQVSSVIVMDYTGLGWAIMWGWLVFNQFPPAMTWLGGPIIIASGAVIIYREQQLARRATHGTQETR
jgi:drug/metabolite transporter (DMT)-like permease